LVANTDKEMGIAPSCRQEGPPEWIFWAGMSFKKQ